MDSANIAVEYIRARHAAHYAYSHPAKGHDLEQWTFAGSYGTARPDAVPCDAEYNHGFMQAGVAHLVYVRRAPLSAGSCALCAGNAAK